MELLFGTCVVNAWELHREFWGEKKMSLLHFRGKIIDILVTQHTLPPQVRTVPQKTQHFL